MGFVVLSVLGSVLTGCVGPLFMNLAPKKELPPLSGKSDYVILTGESDAYIRFYWTAEPVWGETIEAKDLKEARRLGYWKGRVTANDPAVRMRKVTGNFGSSTCFWEPIRVSQVVKEEDGELGRAVTILPSDSNDQFALDCAYFDNIPTEAQLVE